MWPGKKFPLPSFLLRAMVKLYTVMIEMDGRNPICIYKAPCLVGKEPCSCVSYAAPAIALPNRNRLLVSSPTPSGSPYMVGNIADSIPINHARINASKPFSLNVKIEQITALYPNPQNIYRRGIFHQPGRDKTTQHEQLQRKNIISCSGLS